MTKQYIRHSWIDPRIEIRPSKIHGQGSFARAPIKIGELVTIWGGEPFTVDDLRAGKAKPGTVAAISETLVLASPAGVPDAPDQYLNHSCDPNVWMQNEVTLTARRVILPNDELTADYAMWEGDEDWVMPWQCTCGSPLCRGTVTGRDWRLPELQERYRGHFSPFLNERITRLRQATSNPPLERTLLTQRRSPP